MGLYAIITADIIQSRKQEIPVASIRNSIDGFGSEYLAKPFAISRGDEIQGVLSEVGALPILVRRLRYIVRPFRLRIGLSIGEIDKKELENAGSSWDLSGIVFFDARTALDSAKHSKISNTFFVHDNEVLSIAMNTSLFLLETVERGWTEKQWEAVHTYEAEGTYEKAAKVLGVTAPTVQEHCEKASWSVVRAAETGLAKLIDLSLGN
ncbi:MAG: SatD family protein [Mesotoga sp.]|nr:SatD family protein [Mesotoga sp.]MDI9369235.1 SatD family protein [Thermotogota bacterium]